MKKKNLYIVLGVAAVALLGYAYLVYIDVDGDDESFNGEENEGDLRCSGITPYACSTEGEMMFRDANGNEVQITEECCNELGYTFGGNATTSKNACLCDTPGEDVIDWVRPGLG